MESILLQLAQAVLISGDEMHSKALASTIRALHYACFGSDKTKPKINKPEVIQRGNVIRVDFGKEALQVPPKKRVTAPGRYDSGRNG